MIIFSIMWSENYDEAAWNILYTGTNNDHHCFSKLLSTVLCIFTHERWSWEADPLTVMWTDRSGTAESRALAWPAGQGWHQGTLRFPLCPPAWFCLTTCSILTRNQPACTQREESRDPSYIWWLTMSPVVISLISQGQHWGGARTRAVTCLVTRSETGIF